MAGLNSLSGAATLFAGGYATFKFILMGIGHMEKNPQKVEAARDGMKNIVVGLGIALLAFAITAWLKGIFG